jgi:site-specific DNA recombinase
MRFASYIRVSTEEQAKDSKFGLERQRLEIAQYLSGLGFSVQQEFQDTISGTKATRAGLEQLFQAARDGLFTAVVFSEYDRVGRNTFVTFSIVAELLDIGITVHSAADGVMNPENINSRRDFGYRAIEADTERDKIRRRMRAGQLSKVRGGTPLAPLNQYGYRNNEIHEPEAQWVRWFFENIKHKGIHVLTKEINSFGVPTSTGKQFWSHKVVACLLKNPRFKGVYIYGSESCACPAIVTEEVWNTAQFALSRRRRNSGREGKRTNIFSLQGRIRCGVCGSAMSGGNIRRDNSGRILNGFYSCRRRVAGIAEFQCSHYRHYHSQKLHTAVREVLEAAFSGSVDIASLVRVAPPAPIDYQPQKKRIREELAKLEAAFLAGAFTAPEFAERKKSRMAALVALDKQAQQTKAPQTLDVAEVRRTLENALKNDDLFLLARDLGLKVVVHADESLELEVIP